MDISNATWFDVNKEYTNNEKLILETSYVYPLIDETRQTMNITQLYICVYISCNLNTKEVIAQDNNQNILVLTVEYSKMMEDGFSSQSSLTNNDVLSIDTRLVLRHTLR